MKIKFFIFLINFFLEEVNLDRQGLALIVVGHKCLKMFHEIDCGIGLFSCTNLDFNSLFTCHISITSSHIFSHIACLNAHFFH
jgi:hypothetical protein